MNKSIFKRRSIIISSLLLLFIFVPLLIFAQSTVPTRAPQDLKEFICLWAKLAMDFVPLIIVLTVGAFLTGLIKYVASGDNAEKRMEGIKMMIYGVVGLFFMVSVWGILAIWTNTYNLPLLIPQFKSTGGTGGCGSGL